MNEQHDPLETELSALRPNEISTGLRRRIAESLAEVRPAKLRRIRWIAVAGGVATTCLGLALLLWQVGQHRSKGKYPVPNPAPPESVQLAPMPRPPSRAGDVSPWLRTQEYEEYVDAPYFTWPLEESSPIRALMPIPSELLD
jgi:hypothetical protein